MSFEAYDDRGVSDAAPRMSTGPRQPMTLEAYDDRGRTGAPDKASKAPSTSAPATLARRALSTGARALMAPVKAGAGLLRNVVDTSGVRALDPDEALDQGESYLRDEPVAATRARRQAGERAYGDWAAAGDVAGEIGAAGVQGGAMKAAASAKAAAPALAHEAAGLYANENGALGRGAGRVPIQPDPGPYLQAHPEYPALDDYVGSSVMMNRELREAGQMLPPRSQSARAKALEKAGKIGKVLDDADKAGFSEAGTTYRGVDLPPGVADKWEKTGYVDNHTFWSTSKNEGKARAFSGEHSDREPVLLRLRGKNGVPLGSAGLGGGVEEEVLFGRRKNWKVLGSEVGPDGVRVMDLQQVDSVPDGVRPEVGALERKSDRRYG